MFSAAGGGSRLRAASAELAIPTSSSPLAENSVSKNTESIINYAINFARASETFEVHSWAILLGVLKHESSHAAKILVELGITDLYGAWHEVLWAMNVSNGLDARAPSPDVAFSDRALKVILGAGNFATWGGRTKVQSEDLVMALAAGEVLSGLFPDLNITFDKVRRAAAKHGHKYALPDDTAESKKAAEEDSIF